MQNASVRSVLVGRGLLLLPVAALGVHEARYGLGFGAEAGAVEAAHGHGYLDSLGPLVMLLLGLALGGFLVRLASALSGRPSGRPRRTFAATWLLATSGLVAIYTTQELLEGVLAAGHPTGLEGVFGHGGWWSLVAAVLFGAVLAALVRLASVAVEAAAKLAPPRRSWARVATMPRPSSAVPPQRGVLASAAAGRAPPIG